MADFSKIFESYPDYDVFDESKSKNKKSCKKNKQSGNFDFITYDEKQDFRNKKNHTKKSPATPAEDNKEDYGDDFGIYRVVEEKNKNYGTILFFPITIIWLEIILRLSCEQPLLSFNMIFVLLFSLSISSLLTVFCTFFGSRVNRVISTIITLAITIWYCLQIVNFNMSESFLLLSTHTPAEQTLSYAELVIDSMSDRVFYMIASFAPLATSLIAGKYIFPFRRIRIPAKVCLVLLAVLLHFSAITAISLDKNTTHKLSNHAVYHENYQGNTVQERFGLYIMECKDISRMIW